MNVEDITYAVPGPALIVNPQFPERLSCQNVQIPSGASVQELSLRQLQHAYGYQREMPFHLFADFPQHYRTRHIRCAAHILTAGIHQIHALGSQFFTFSLFRLIMHHRRIFFICTDSGKGKIQKSVQFPAQAVQLPGRRHFRNLFFPDGMLQPVNKPDQRRAVLSVRLFHPFQFRPVLHRFQFLRRVIPFHIFRIPVQCLK